MRSSSSELLLDRGASRRYCNRRRRHVEEEGAEEDEEEAGEEEVEERRRRRSPGRSRRVRPSEGRGTTASCSREAETELEEKRDPLLGNPGGRRWEAWGEGRSRGGFADESFGGRPEWSDEDSWGARGAPGLAPGPVGRGAVRGRAECKRKKRRRSWGQRFRFYLTAFLALALTVSASALLFLVPLYVDPAVSTLRADFRPEPAVCVTNRRVERAGLANCSLSQGPSSPTAAALPAASSCREGCTSDLYRCTQIFVLYSPSSFYREHVENVTSEASSPLPSSPPTSTAYPTEEPTIPAPTAASTSTPSAKTTSTTSTTTTTTEIPSASPTASEASAYTSPVTVLSSSTEASSSTQSLSSPDPDTSSSVPETSSPLSKADPNTTAVGTGSPATSRRRRSASYHHHHDDDDDEEEEDDEDDEEDDEDEEDEEDDDDDLEEAVLLVNIKGCGYPPEVNCSTFDQLYGMQGSTFPCYYSRSNHSLVLAHFEPARERARIVNMFVAPFAVAAASASALCFLHCECCRRSPRGRGGRDGGKLLLEGGGRRRGRVEHLSDVSISTANKALSPSSEAVSFYSRPL